MPELSPASCLASADSSPVSHMPQAATQTASRKRASSPENGIPDRQAEPRRKKRAPVACRMCKSRKIRCSNDRPKCTNCVRLQCECLYPEDAHKISEHEPSQRIISTLDEILNRLPEQLESSKYQSASQGASAAEATFTVLVKTSVHPRVLTPIAASDGQLLVSVEVSGHTCLDAVFHWPCISKMTLTHWPRRSPLFMADQEQGTDDLEHQRLNSIWPSLEGVADTMRLVNLFLSNVNTKNPILDRQALLRDARVVAETGPTWDARSCLVLLACALGAISESFDQYAVTRDCLLQSKSEPRSKLRLQAETFYHSAQRRLGLLDRGLQAIQCHFLSGIYNMYALRPIQAWQSFVQASTLYLVYSNIHGTLNQREGLSVSRRSQESLEQRLFWSCLKSECEMVLELPLSQSSLHTIDSPCMFPSPPTSDPPEDVRQRTALDRGRSAQATDLCSFYLPSSMSEPIGPEDPLSLHNQSWFYYLTEISLLRLNNRIVQSFYTVGPAAWTTMNVLDMCSEAIAFERQLHQCVDYLPEPIRFDDLDPNIGQHSELQHMTWGRYTKIKRLLYRPFLYRFVHCEHEDSLLRQLIQPYAEKCVLACLDPASHIGLRHRHHGTWFWCRESAVAALLLLAANSAGLVSTMGKETQAEYYLKLFIGHLQYWEAESVDIRLARQLIEEIHNATIH